MKLRRFAKFVATVAFAFAVLGLGSAGAGVLYDNGVGATTPGYNTNAFGINSGYSTTDSFSLSQSSNVNGVDFVVWAYPGDTPLFVNWAITTSDFGGTTVASGTGISLTNAYLTSNLYGYDIDRESFAFSNVLLAGSTTYWLQLSLATTSGNYPLFWDDNNGPSAAFLSGYGSLANFGGVSGTGSETFQILGQPQQTGQTPEPGTAALLGAGLVLAGILRRRL